MASPGGDREYNFPGMTGNSFPTRFPIFPLPNVVLFPNAYLPLHIFEPRYRAMTRHALDRERVIGMVLLSDGGSGAADPRPPVYPTGCAGSIVEVQELEDGRYNLVLQAEHRFEIVSERLTDAGYRLAETELLREPTADQLSAGSRQALGALRPQLESSALELTRTSAPTKVDVLKQRMAQLDDIALINALCFGLDCATIEKQSLLEACDPESRARLLLRLIEMRKAERRHPEGGKTVN